jgi:hypothetical protein
MTYVKEISSAVDWIFWLLFGRFLNGDRREILQHPLLDLLKGLTFFLKRLKGTILLPDSFIYMGIRIWNLWARGTVLLHLKYFIFCGLIVCVWFLNRFIF